MKIQCPIGLAYDVSDAVRSTGLPTLSVNSDVVTVNTLPHVFGDNSRIAVLNTLQDYTLVESDGGDITIIGRKKPSFFNYFQK